MARNSPLISTAEVSRRLGIAPSTVTRWAVDGILPCIVLPTGVRRYAAADIDELLRTGARAAEGNDGPAGLDVDEDVRAERTEDAAGIAPTPGHHNGTGAA